MRKKNKYFLGIKTLLPTGGASGKTLSKLGSLFSVKNTDWIEVDFSRWSNPTHDREKFDTLKNAVTQRYALAFSYPDSAGEISERKAYPLKLVFQGQAWYIQAFCLLKEDYRTFKIHRMIDVEVLPETFDAALYMPPPVVSQNSPPHGKTHIRAVFASTVAYRIYDEFNPEDIEKNADGSFTVDTSMPFDEWVYGYFLSYGDAVRILEPTALRETLQKKIKEMLKNYSE